jgi:serine/threonine protein phosphatase PrpC
MGDTTVRRPVNWACSAQTDVGNVRQVNEDSILSRPDAGLWVVADGMGGYQAGDVASGMVVSALEDFQPREHLSDNVDAIEDALLDVNARILEYAEIMLDAPTVGSTVVGLFITGRVGVCLWAGDSRLYRYRNGALQQLSQDHSQVEELLQQGVIGREEADNHPEMNVITRAVGAADTLYLDVNVFSTRVGDTFILCSDGLHNAVDLERSQTIFEQPEAGQIADGLMSRALDNGASDNVSVIVVKGEPGAAAGVRLGAAEEADPLND